MFGPFRGPLPEGVYLIRNSKYEALRAPSIVNDMALSVQKEGSDNRNGLCLWVLEYGRWGYRIKNQASGNILSYTPWGVPARLIGKDNHITVSAESPVEWGLVQTSSAGEPRAFQLQIVAGNHLKPNDDLALGWDNNKFRVVTGASGSSFTFRGMAAIASTVPSSLDVKDGTICLIRSVYFPHIALEHRPSDGNLVLGRAVSNEMSQVWIFEKTNNGFKIKNAESNKYLDTIVVLNTPHENYTSMVCQDSASDQWGYWTIVKSLQGFEIRSTKNTNYLPELWNLDAGNNGWVYHSYNPPHGTADTAQQWIFTEPGKD